MSQLCTDLTWMIGGPQGSGVDSSATLFARVAAAAGYSLFGKKEYHSNIKGEHSYFPVRIRLEPTHSNLDLIHLLATFEHSTAVIHAHCIVPNGGLIYDPKVTQLDQLEMDESVRCFAVPFDELIQTLADKTGESPAKLQIVKNVLAVGASMALLGMEISALEEALKGLFTGRRAKLVALNVQAGQLAYDYMKAQTGCSEFPFKLAPVTNAPKKGSRLVVDGAKVSGMGKLYAGCRFQSYYSITPAVDECIYLDEHPEYGCNVMQCEDEIAAICMAIGASVTGARSSCSTSGPGFALKAEATGWAGINEVPVVIYNYQRGGPSTGLPTRSEQADLLFAIHAGHGEFPRVVLAPGDFDECFHLSFESFNMADRYQMPVIMLIDKALANSTGTMNLPDTAGLKINRGKVVTHSDTYVEGDAASGITKYPRFAITEDGVSPRPFAGTPGTLFWMTGDEHDEWGHITEEPEIRLPMQTKRMKKLDLALSEIPESMQYTLYGPEQADITIVGWGSTKGAVIDALPALQAQGKTVNYLHIRLMHPFPTEAVTRILNAAKNVVCIESNYTGQLTQLIRLRTGIQISHEAHKWTGRPISQTEVMQTVDEVLDRQTKRVVLTYGH